MFGNGSTVTAKGARLARALPSLAEITMLAKVPTLDWGNGVP